MHVFCRRYYTLRQRIMAVFLMCAFTVLAIGGVVVGYTYRNLVVQRVNSIYYTNVKQFVLSLSDLMNVLNHTSQQLAYNETVKLYFERYLSSADSYSRISAMENLKKTANMIVFSNPNIGLYTYSNTETNDIYIGNIMSGRSVERPKQSSLLFEYSGVSYYGSFPSQSGYSDRAIIAVVRDIEISGTPIYLYLETNFRAVDDLINTYSLSNNHLLLLDNSNKVVFSAEPDIFSEGTIIDIDDSGGNTLHINGYFLFPAQANQGWTAVEIVEESIYHNELKSLVHGYVLACGLLLVIFGLLFVVLWHRIYRPLVNYSKIVDSMFDEEDDAAQDLTVPCKETGIVEFDQLVEKALETKQQLYATIAEVRHQEHLNAQMMVRRLRSQINPHFLMNTLDTVHWMANMSGNDEIDEVVTSLNRLLSYNLKQGSDIATLQEELKAVEQYILLQSKRYDIHYEMQCIPENADLCIPFPKFIIQPIVENSLSHGYRQGMCISLTVKVSDFIEITVSDNGIGMSTENLALLEKHLAGVEDGSETVQHGMGIGMRYVVKILRMAYGESVTFSVTSLPQQFTTITITVPKEINERNGCLDC